MDLIYLLFVIIAICVVVGLVLWAVNKFIPMDAQIKQVMNAGVVIVLVIVILFIVIRLLFSEVHIPNVLK